MSTKKHRLMITLSDELSEYIRALSEERGMSMSAIVSSMLYEYMDQKIMIEKMKTEEWQKAVTKYIGDGSNKPYSR